MRHYLRTSGFTAGAAAGGALLGLAAGLVGGIAVNAAGGELWRGLIVGAVIIIVLADLRPRRECALLSSHWQVPRHWALLGTPIYEAMFGAVLGLGFLTVVPYAGYYLVLGLAAVSPDILSAMAVGTSFGVGRSLPMLGIALLPGNRSPSVIRQKVVRLVGFLKGSSGASLRWSATGAGLVALLLG